MASSIYNKIFAFFRRQPRERSNYANVEGELGDLELNIPQAEQNTSIESEQNNNRHTNKNQFAIKYQEFKMKMYTLFVKQLNKFMEYPRNTNTLNTNDTTPPNVYIDVFVLQFLFVIGFLLKSPVMWLLGSILYFFSNKNDKKVITWSIINLVMVVLTIAYFIYAALDPYGYYSIMPRIGYEYKNAENNT